MPLFITTRRFGRLLGSLAVLLLLHPGTRVFAQATCEQELSQAEEHYTFGRFDEAIRQLDRCLDDRQPTDEERRRAYRLLALSRLGLDEPDAARAAVRELLAVQPGYEPDPAQDPPPFVQMVREAKGDVDRPPSPDAVSRERGGISKWVWIGGGALLAGAAAVLLLSGSGDDEEDGGNGGGPTTRSEAEPNNSPAQAQVIRGTPPVTVNGRADVNDASDLGRTFDDGTFDDFEDWYQVTLSAPGLQLTLSGLQADCDLYLMEPGTLNFIGSSDNSGVQAEGINIGNLAAGTYLIGVSIFDLDPQGSTSTPYTLTINGAVPGSQLQAALQKLYAPGGAELASTFRLVARTGDEAVPLRAALPDPSDTRWTAYHEEGTGLAEYDATDTFRFRAGRGFWVQSVAPLPPSSVVSAPASGTVAVPLHPGWNVIANPFDAPVAWGRVQAANGVMQALWRWDGHFEPAEELAPARSGEAYYFLNAAGLEALKVPPMQVGLAPTRPHRRARPVLTLSAYREGRLAASVRVGLAPDAAVGLDGYDQLAPPGHFEAAHLRLTREVTTERRLELAAEFRPPDAAGQRFDLVLEAPGPASITLRAEGLDGFVGYAVSLIDVERGLAYDLRRQPVLTLTPGEGARKLRLVVGHAAFVAAAREALAPAAPTLANFPNPFNPSTTLSYTVPREAASVRLEVFDVTGRRMRFLVDGVQEPGTYEATWDGTGEGGAPAASGVYLARLQVGPHVQVRRMLLVK